MEIEFKIWETGGMKSQKVWAFEVNCEFILNGKRKRLTKTIESGGMFIKTGIVGRNRVEETKLIELHDFSEISGWKSQAKIDIVNEAKNMIGK